MMYSATKAILLEREGEIEVGNEWKTEWGSKKDIA